MAISMQRTLKETDPVMLEMLEENYQSALRAGQIIRGLRQLVRKEDGNRKETDINDLVETIVELMNAEARAASVVLNLCLVSANNIKTQEKRISLFGNKIMHTYS